MTSEINEMVVTFDKEYLKELYEFERRMIKAPFST